MKTKLLSLALALVMCLGLMVPASAEVLYNNEPLYDDIKMTVDSNGTISLTGTGELDPAILLDLGEEFCYGFASEYPNIKTVTINIGTGITLEDESAFEEVCKILKEEIAPNHGITTININRSSAPASTAAPAAPAQTPTPAPAPTPAPTASKFTDVAANSPYKDAINWAVEEGITKGTTATTFGPNQTCTVSHILTFILRSEGVEPDREIISEFCEELSQYLEIPSLKPDQPCTRILAVTFLSTLFGDGSTGGSVSFTDVPSSPSYYPDAVAWAVAKGVTTGTSATTFSPNNICTRGQIVTFLYRLLKTA